MELLYEVDEVNGCRGSTVRPRLLCATLLDGFRL